MNGARFDGDWLALREAVDHRSRAHALTEQVNRYLYEWSGDSPVIVDLGAGWGSNMRYLSPRLDGRPRWRLLDNDPDLLAAIKAGSPGDEAITTEILDLSEPLGPILAGADLVTDSALLDLVSAEWIEAFSDACLTAGAAVLIALSVDGRVRFSDADPWDELIRTAVAFDQRRDKGFGLALGADAPRAQADALAAPGYAVTSQPSDWHLDRADAALTQALIDSWREAAQRQCRREREAIAGWAQRRMRAAGEGRLQLTIGHVDVLGLPRN